MNALLAQPMETVVFETELEQATQSPQRPHLTLVPKPAPANTTLHNGAFRALAVVNVAILAVFALTFLGDAEALFMVAISGVYLAAYMATPYIMSRVGRFDTPQAKPFHQFLNEPFETWTGVITGREALLQVLLIPTAILIAVTGMALIIAGVR